MSKLVLRGHIVVPAEDLAAVLSELPNHIALTRNEKGCLRFDVTQSPEDERSFRVYEEFIDRPAFEAHQRRASNSRWGQITAKVERHYQVVELK